MSLLLAAGLLAGVGSLPFPTRAGSCGWVDGRFRIANGSSIQRLRVIGTRHVLAFRDDDDRYPPALRHLVGSTLYRPTYSAIVGRFRVCARERWRPGHLQHVRLISARALVIRQPAIRISPGEVFRSHR